MKKRFACVLFSLVLCFSLVAQELPVNPVIEKLKSISVTVEAGEDSGSGIVVHREDYCFVLTCYHVVESLRVTKKVKEKEEISWKDCKVVQKTIQDGRVVGETSQEAEILKADKVEDLALLLLRQKKAFREGVTFYLGEQIPPIGTKLFHVGSPLGEIGSQSVIPGFYSAHGRVLNKVIFDSISCNAFPGSSGGAVTLEDGRWVGMILKGRDGGFVLIKPVRSLKEWTKKQKINFLLDHNEKIPDLDELRKSIDVTK